MNPTYGRKADMSDRLKIRITVLKGVEGPCLAVEDGSKPHSHGGRRVAGPKPWGGSQGDLHEFWVDPDEMKRAIDDAVRCTDGPDAA